MCVQIHAMGWGLPRSGKAASGNGWPAWAGGCAPHVPTSCRTAWGAWVLCYPFCMKARRLTACALGLTSCSTHALFARPCSLIFVLADPVLSSPDNIRLLDNGGPSSSTMQRGAVTKSPSTGSKRSKALRKSGCLLQMHGFDTGMPLASQRRPHIPFPLECSYPLVKRPPV